MAFALSTSWNAFRHDDAKKLIFEIKSLGFKDVELSFNLTAEMVSGIRQLVDSGEIRVLSLHNFCPIPDGLKREEALPDCYSLASLDEAQRQLSIKYTKRTIDTASSLNATAVVLHTGRVEIADKTRWLIEYYQQGLKRPSAEFKQLKTKIIEERNRYIKPHFENILKSLDEIVPYACKRDISLGIETRFYYREIPTFEEISVILDIFKDSNIFYWHDTGHAQLMEDLGFIEHKKFLDAYGSRMLGIHLHDIIKASDHQPPGIGEIDFTFLKPYLNSRTIKIMEVHHPADAEAIRQAKAFLEKICDGKS